jgi:four helix bundle protein
MKFWYVRASTLTSKAPTGCTTNHYAKQRHTMNEEQTVKSFRDMVVWNRSIELCVAVYEFTRTFPSDELYGLRSQLRRASVSIPSNIAEGCGRRSTGELIQFIGIARGSNFEVQTQLVIATRLSFGTPSGLANAINSP